MRKKYKVSSVGIFEQDFGKLDMKMIAKGKEI